MQLNLNTMSQNELATLIIELTQPSNSQQMQEIFFNAAKLRNQYYGNRILLRGLIECSSYCIQNCYYCGLRSGNKKAERYRLTDSQILESCQTAHRLGFRTFVLQSGEDPAFTDFRISNLIGSIKSAFPDTAITLSFGEKNRSSLESLYAAGAERYLLRHETADPNHFSVLHPASQSFENREKCLYHIKQTGFQTGAGFMVGSPFQTPQTLAQDLFFLRQLQPHMVGIGPFIPHQDTPFKEHPAGSVTLTLVMLALVRLMLPKVLLPATTALGIMSPNARQQAFSAGANVVMPNLTPNSQRDAYSLYNGKSSSSTESAESLDLLCAEIQKAGLQPDFSRGDVLGFN